MGWIVRECAGAVAGLLDRYLGRDERLHFIAESCDVLLAVLRGLLDPKYAILDKQDADCINGIKLRDWLIENGASPRVVREGSFVRALYDAAFEYRDGDLGRPSLEAGTALRGLLRMVATYKGACFYEVAAGMGDVVIAPLYEVLAARGVRFRFFHKLVQLELSADGSTLDAIRLAEQVRLASEVYAPLVRVGGLACWPAEPLWEQIEGGAAMRAAGVDLSSHWCAWPAAGEVRLERGRDFDLAVLAVALGAYKPLGAGPGMCDEIISRHEGFRDLVENLGIVPTLGVQLWLNKDLAELGFDFKRPDTRALPAMVPGPEPLDTWADMSQVLAFERWQGTAAPRSLQYFCGPFATDLYRTPASRTDTPARAAAEVRKIALDWLDAYPGFLWPAAARPGSLGLDWSVLHDPENRSGAARFEAQFWRANVDPSECCVGSFVDTARHRLRAHETGVGNLFLAGECVRTALDVTCVEAAVMSGMQAARAISGSPVRIVGEDFLARA
jgi:uncharacterized protein with NAD-binding domain and iron-sulfur cluster